MEFTEDYPSKVSQHSPVISHENRLSVRLLLISSVMLPVCLSSVPTLPFAWEQPVGLTMCNCLCDDAVCQMVSAQNSSACGAALKDRFSWEVVTSVRHALQGRRVPGLGYDEEGLKVAAT